MVTEDPIPVRYVLYSHYPEGNDFKDYSSGKNPSELTRVKLLVKHLTGLRGLLTWPGYEGLLVLFYAPGFAKCLEGIARGEDEITLVRTYQELEFARAVETYLNRLLGEKYRELLPRFRFITPLDLQRIFGRMNRKMWKITEQLQSWFVGRGEGVKYDSPKTVEAIVRLRLLGSGIPVFRVDQDVLFREKENWMKKNLEFSSTIGSCLKAYELKRDSPNIFSFIFSASYDCHALHTPTAANNFSTWSRAFATRVFPALPVKKDLLKKVRSREDKYTWHKYATDSFSQSLAKKFYGFDNDLNSSIIEGIGKIGAHPLTSVISGAMLYLSDGAILDLPPFSNFRLNVMWIDDHLKYSLHRELGHLSRAKAKAGAVEARYDPLLSHSRLEDVIVQKAGRRVGDNFPQYLFNDYLPTLLWGMIMDAWITPNPILKYRRKDLSDEDRIEISRLSRKEQSEAVLASALQKALVEGGLGFAEKNSLKNSLINVAIKRINEVRRQWIDLTENGTETFASIWAKTKVKSFFPRLKLRYTGIADNGLEAYEDITHEDHIDRHLYSDLLYLVEDAIDYIEWTLQWPKIVQVVRSIEQGTLRTDLKFDPERERAEMPDHT
jgi:hypothetical protein